MEGIISNIILGTIFLACVASFFLPTGAPPKPPKQGRLDPGVKK